MGSLANSFCSLFWTKILLILWVQQSALVIFGGNLKMCFLKLFCKGSLQSVFSMTISSWMNHYPKKMLLFLAWLYDYKKVLLSVLVAFFGFLYLSLTEVCFSVLKHHAYIEAFVIMVGKYSKSWLAKRLHPANGERNYSLMLGLIDFTGYR